MSWDLWEVVGGVGAATFFLRFLVQWWAPEKAGRSVSPASFWWLSLAGSDCLGAAAFAHEEPVLLPGFLITGMIYARTLWIDHEHGETSRLGPVPAALLGVAAAGAALYFGWQASEDRVLMDSAALLAVGVIGQTIWTSRFLVQWWYIERRGYSHFPTAFWWITLAGAGFNLWYTATRESPVYLISFLPTPLYPVRNLILEHRHRRRAAREGQAPAREADAGP